MSHYKKVVLSQYSKQVHVFPNRLYLNQNTKNKYYSNTGTGNSYFLPLLALTADCNTKCHHKQKAGGCHRNTPPGISATRL